MSASFLDAAVEPPPTTTGFHVSAIVALSDNYMYLIVDITTKKACVVDPVDADEIVNAAKAQGATITAVLTTHHHYDHAGGNDKMKALVPGVEVVGGEAVQGCTRQVVDGEIVRVGELSVRCVLTPAHTNGHMSYLVSNPAQPESDSALFSGDALFVGGCGRFFEGGPEQMVEGLRKLAALPARTQLYCGHEYTVKNLQFALSVEPENEAAQRKIMWAQERRAVNAATVPSTIGGELEFNPFMRVQQPSVRQFTGLSGPRAAAEEEDILVMRKIRNAKDKFAGYSRPWIPGGGPLPGL